MKMRNLAVIALTTAAVSFGQLKLPKLSDVKDKLSQKSAPAASTPASTPDATPAPAQPATDQPAANQTAKAEPAKTSTPQTFTPLPPGSTKGSMQGQGVEVTLCEKGMKEGQWDVACAKPARTFQYLGKGYNVHATFRFNPPLTNQSPRFKVMLYKGDNLTQYDEYREVDFRPGGRTASVSFTKTAGNYTFKLVNQYKDEEVALVDHFVVAPDTVGVRANGDSNLKSGSGKLMICSEIDDNWKCVNESTTWAANKTFNMYIRLPEAISGIVAGWQIYKQNPDGTDKQLVDDFGQGTQGRAAYWATTQGFRLPAGKYTIYSIDWTTRTSSGDLKQYFGKTTLTVQ
jgi:hypothetical protein